MPTLYPQYKKRTFLQRLPEMLEDQSKTAGKLDFLAKPLSNFVTKTFGNPVTKLPALGEAAGAQAGESLLAPGLSLRRQLPNVMVGHPQYMAETYGARSSPKALQSLRNTIPDNSDLMASTTGRVTGGRGFGRYPFSEKSTLARNDNAQELARRVNIGDPQPRFIPNRGSSQYVGPLAHPSRNIHDPYSAMLNPPIDPRVAKRNSLLQGLLREAKTDDRAYKQLPLSGRLSASLNRMGRSVDNMQPAGLSQDLARLLGQSTINTYQNPGALGKLKGFGDFWYNQAPNYQGNTMLGTLASRAPRFAARAAPIVTGLGGGGYATNKAIDRYYAKPQPRNEDEDDEDTEDEDQDKRGSQMYDEQLFKKAEDSIKKAFLVPTALGTGAGAGLGYLNAPEDKKTEGSIRGALRGAGTGLGTYAGMGLGQVLGALGGLGLGAYYNKQSVPHFMGSPTQLSNSEAIGGLGGVTAGSALGGLGGGALGYYLTGKGMGKPSWDTDKHKEKKANAAGTIAGAGLGGLAGGALGTGAGAIGGEWLGLLLKRLLHKDDHMFNDPMFNVDDYHAPPPAFTTGAAVGALGGMGLGSLGGAVGGGMLGSKLTSKRKQEEKKANAIEGYGGDSSSSGGMGSTSLGAGMNMAPTGNVGTTMPIGDMPKIASILGWVAGVVAARAMRKRADSMPMEMPKSIPMPNISPPPAHLAGAPQPNYPLRPVNKPTDIVNPQFNAAKFNAKPPANLTDDVGQNTLPVYGATERNANQQGYSSYRRVNPRPGPVGTREDVIEKLPSRYDMQEHQVY